MFDVPSFMSVFLAANPSCSAMTDSPWYWIYLFCTAGLIALVLAEPRFSARQAQIERNYQARQRAVQRVAGREAVTPLSTPSDTSITLRPLYVLLGLLLAVAWGRLGWSHFRRRSAQPADPASWSADRGATG